jgi:hypothetical protein
MVSALPLFRRAPSKVTSRTGAPPDDDRKCVALGDELVHAPDPRDGRRAPRVAKEFGRRGVQTAAVIGRVHSLKNRRLATENMRVNLHMKADARSRS